ncbi:PR5-like receptor kinase, partial [Fagus crenata]
MTTPFMVPSRKLAELPQQSGQVQRGRRLVPVVVASSPTSDSTPQSITASEGPVHLSTLSSPRDIVPPEGPASYPALNSRYRASSPGLYSRSQDNTAPEAPRPVASRTAMASIAAVSSPTASSPRYIVPPEVPGGPQTPHPSPQLIAPSLQFLAPPKVIAPSSKTNWRVLIAIGIPTGVAGILVICFVINCSLKRGYLSSNAIFCWKGDAKNNEINAEEFIKINYGSIVLKRYTYSDVKKLTNSLKEKIGQGGYGGVYKGQLPDGRIVAVKVLKESKGNGEEFINEVASISRTSHVNVVSLLGFCYERNKRALVYEFMSNGSLDKFIYDKRNCHLDMNTMFQIA